MKRTTPWLIALLLVAAGIGGGYYYRQLQIHQEAKQPAPAAVPNPGEAEEKTPAKPLVRYPLPQGEGEQSGSSASNSTGESQAGPAAPSASATGPLPPLSDSDPALKDKIEALTPAQAPPDLFNLDHIVRRIVVTVDNLPRTQVPPKYRFVKPIPGKFVTSGEDGELTLNPANYDRYRPYVDVFEGLDTRAVVEAYIRLYPLFQRSYQSLGYPKGYFNDRLIVAIDDMLDAPQPPQPIKLKRPSVMFKFVDPKLEALSAGQKIMIRMGPDNARRVKAKLRDFRAELLRQVRKRETASN